MVPDRKLSELAAASAEIGSNELLVQGPGGNTSIKSRDELWVKASGLWLSEATERSIFVPIDLAALRERGTAEVADDLVIRSRGGSDLRPSIETLLHAVVPHPVCLHTHSVNAMTVSVLRDGPAIAAERLAGLAWAWIPYCRPGTPLAQTVAETMAARDADILLLQNHGLVIGAETPAAAIALLQIVEERLAQPVRELPAPDPHMLEQIGDSDYEIDQVASMYALDATTADVLTKGALIPDQTLFLGGAVPALRPGESAMEAAEGRHARTGVWPSMMLSPSIGTVSRRDRSKAAEAVVNGLLAIACRLAPGAEVCCLSDNDVSELLGWEAEHYRQ
ncbi:MAG: class II aldolase/adducin family protein, partial [Pseudomonadota bacterium]